LSSAIKMESTGLSPMQLRQQMPALANKTYFN
jgi:L-cysteine/cystine lyase